MGYIVLPVYLGDTEDVEEEILASRFRDVWQVILALKSQDDSLADVLDRLRVELGERGEIDAGRDGLSRIIIDLPERLQKSMGKSFQTLMIEGTTDNWMENYGRLLRYADENGRATPPRRPSSDRSMGTKPKKVVQFRAVT